MKISYRWQFAISAPVLRINGPGCCASGSPIGWKRVYTVHKRIFNAFHRLRSRSLRRVERKPWTNHVSWEIFWFYIGGTTFLRFARTKGNEMKKRNDRRFVGKQDFPSALWFNPLALSFFFIRNMSSRDDYRVRINMKDIKILRTISIKQALFNVKRWNAISDCYRSFFRDFTCNRLLLSKSLLLFPGDAWRVITLRSGLTFLQNFDVFVNYEKFVIFIAFFIKELLL